MFEKLGMRLDAIYSKRLNRIALQFFMFFLGAMYSAYFAPHATQTNTELGSKAGELEASFAVLDWFCFILLCRTLFFDRVAFAMGALAGFCWLFVGDAVALPCWAGTMALLVHIYRSSWSKLGKIHVWYLFLWFSVALKYGSIYEYTAHPVYLTLFALLFAGYLLYEQALKVIARRQQARLAMLAEAEREKEKLADLDKVLVQRISRLEQISDLPGPLLVELAQIIHSAQQIVVCMKTDKRDEVPGRRFLDRYLPGVEMIVTQGQSLSKQLVDDALRQKTTEDQLDMLTRLRSAFHQQHQALQENDTDDFDSELRTLDKLLKTDGYVK
ncbi:MAG: hypothetical protein H6R25_654 [Proteobacteria bacterium]|nr:hypothetical protein [Pseudomonadota bacterium]